VRRVAAGVQHVVSLRATLREGHVPVHGAVSSRIGERLTEDRAYPDQRGLVCSNKKVASLVDPSRE